MSKLRCFQLAIYFLIFVLAFEVIIFTKLSFIQNKIIQNNRNLISSNNQVLKDAQTLNSEDRINLRSLLNNQLYERMQERLRNNFGANYYRNQHIMDPSNSISAEDFKKQMLKEKQTIETR